MKKRTKNSKYDTNPLREKIRQKMNFNAFYEKVSAQTGVKPATICTHVVGQSVPPYEEIKCYAKILNMDADDIAALYNKKRVSPKQITKNDKYYGKRFNGDALDKAIKKAGMSRNKVCKIIGIAESTCRHWKEPSSKGPNLAVLNKLCTLLGCKPEDLYFNEEQPAPVVEAKEPKKTAEQSLTGFKTIDTLNVIDMIKIINENVLLLAKNVDVMAKLNSSQNAALSDAVAGLSKEVTGLNGTVEALSKKVNGGRPAAHAPQSSDHVILLDSKMKETALKKETKTEQVKQEEQKKIEKDNLIKEYKSLAGEYNADDDFDAYRVKINRMVSLIIHATNETFKHTIHKYYKEMTLVYGVVYRQLEKEYFDKYQKKHRYGSTELLYENEIFREIFYHLISDKLGEIVAAA